MERLQTEKQKTGEDYLCHIWNNTVATQKVKYKGQKFEVSYCVQVLSVNCKFGNVISF
jgi:hypothetical protein